MVVRWSLSIVWELQLEIEIQNFRLYLHSRKAP